MNIILLILILTVIAGVAHNQWRIHRKYKDIVVPEPSVLRTDLMFGYYGALKTQVQETLDETNVLWESQFEGLGKATENILLAKRFTVLDVNGQVFRKIAESGKNWGFNPEAEQNLRNAFKHLQAAGALQYVKALVPIDEPNTNAASVEDMWNGLTVIKRVAGEFPELDGVKYAVIYAAKPTDFLLMEQFDYVGIDDYDKKSQIFVDGTYDSIKKRLLPHQKTIIMPGGAFGQEPTPFINFAHSNPEVGMVLAFVWFNGFVAADKWVGIGDPANNPPNPHKEAYTAAGKKIVALSQKL